MKSEPLKSTFSIRSILEQQDPEPIQDENVSENELIENEDIIDNEKRTLFRERVLHASLTFIILARNPRM